MAWAKLHTDILGDPKLGRATRAGCKGLDLLPWLIAFAKLADDNGRLSVGGHAASAEDIAELIPGKPIRSVQACHDSAASIGVLVQDLDGIWRLANWARRQGKPSQAKESVADRVRRHRARKDGVTETPMEGVTETPEGGVTVTQEERRGEENRGEETPPRYDRLLLKLPNIGGIRWSITEFLEQVPGGRFEGWMPILSACLEGMDLPGGRACTAEQLATVCRDFMTKAEHEWTPKFFRDCVGALMRQASRAVGSKPSTERESRSMQVARTWSPPPEPAT